MIRGIAICGMNGSGKSTLAYMLTKQTGYFEMDVEDYYFPEQKASRIAMSDMENLEELPYANPREKNEVQCAMLEDMNAHSQFVMASVTMNWSEEILSQIDVCFVIQTPEKERLRRIWEREKKRFGTRVLLGGDMYEQQLEFRNGLASRDANIVEESTRRLKCPIIVLDGMVSVTENLEKIMKHLREIGR